MRDFGSDGQVVRYEPFKATTLPELTEPPGYFRREVRQSFQMNWRATRGIHSRVLARRGLTPRAFPCSGTRNLRFL